MRVIWISITIFLLDQLTKYAIQLNQLAESVPFAQGGLTLLIIKNSDITAQQLHAALLNSTSWMLLGGLIVIPLLILRWNTHFHFITFRTLLGLQLTAGGILSHAFDFILRGNAQSSMELRFFDTFSLKAGVADLALMGGFLLLIYVLLSGATRISSKLTLLRATPAKLDLSPLPRGVDNIHIDVLLSPEFCHNITTVVHRLVEAVIKEVLERKPRQTLSATLFIPLKKSFLTLHQDTLHKAKSSGEPPIIDLLYISLIKFVHLEVANSVATKVRLTKDSVQEHHKRRLGDDKNRHYMETLFRQQDLIVAKVQQLILEGLIENKILHLDKGLKGFLGKSRSFAMDAIRSPLVTSNGPDIAAIQFSYYLLFGHGNYSAMSFLEIDRVLDDLLHDYLKLIPKDDSAEDRSRQREFENDSTTAAILSRPSVLMHPANATILLDQQWSQGKIRKIDRFKQWRDYRTHRAHLRFQQRLTNSMVQGLKKAGLAQWIVAVYEAKAILNRTNPEANSGSLVTILLECDSKKELQQRLVQLFRGVITPAKNDEVVKRWETMQQQNDNLLRQHLAAFISDFSRYRRDLQLLYKFHNASNQIALLSDDKAIHTSRANFTLYEFLLPEEKKGNEQLAIRSHIIIKADLRGSTEVTDRLNQLALNPATHFDRNFFSPINEVISHFGAEKVFIEGDAIILILNDYAGSPQANLIASRACGLAANILRIVARQNKELSCYGLPELELGIGIAHSNESPRFLFDGDHKITISPAINRGDRLSACAWSVRNWRKKIGAPTTHVEVYQPSEQALGHGEKAQKELVYNLNGILIEAAVFELLQKELSPKRIVNKLPHKQESRLFAIKVPDVDGTSSSLLIRQAPVKIYDPEYTLDDCQPVEGRYFYEVIHDKKILDTLRNKPRSSAA
jgi:lipoprotein signal peptidase